MDKIFRIFETLSEKNSTENSEFGIETSSIPEIKYHKIGISKEGYPIFFIKCIENGQTNKQINLKIINISLQINCELYTNGILVDSGIYTQVILKSDIWELKKYFIEIFSIFLMTLNEIEEGEKIKIEINKIVNLFSKLSNPPIKTIQGLWAELLLIDLSLNPQYLIDSWHIKSNDKYDFNDGIDKIEVKSTEKTKREHHFSIEQLRTTNNSKLLIASFKIYESGKGTTIFDLSESIKKKISDPNVILKLETLIAESLGTNFDLAFEKFYDYDYGVEHLQFFHSYEIPTINEIAIPKNLSQISFIADLSEIKNIENIDYKSTLHEFLKIHKK